MSQESTTLESNLEVDVFEESQICGDSEIYSLPRFLYLFISSWIAFLGVCGNIVLLYLFTSRKYPNTPPTLYPSVLTVLDALICAMYILLFGADAVIGYLHLESLFITYHIYIVPAFVVSRITQLAIPYMLIFATLERFVWIAGDMRNSVLKTMYSQRGRMITMIVTLTICVLLRLPTFWAVTVYEYPECEDFFRTKTASASVWVTESLVYHVYDFHLLSIAQTVVPFIVLLTFNIVIVKRLYSMKVEGTNGPEYSASTPLKNESSVYGLPEHKPSMTSVDIPSNALLSKRRMNPQVKSAIYTMVAIVASYLLSNTLHLILTGLERSNSDLLKHPTDPNLASAFHTTFSDAVSFVYMFTSGIRIAIYYVCNPAIRTDLNALLKNLFNKSNAVKNTLDTHI